MHLHWHSEPTLILSLLLPGVLYALATGPWRNRFGPGLPWPRRPFLLFITALVLAYLTVGSPLDQIGEEYLFSVHMIQHTLLIYPLPLLFLFGSPPWLIDGLLKSGPLRMVAARVVHPLFGGSVFTLVFSIWHLPTLYEAALRSEAIHIFEHITMLFSALLMWWPIVSPSRRLPASSYPVRMIYIFLLMVAQLPLFGFITFSSEVLYPTYQEAPRLAFLTLTPLADQTFGGVIMKVANMAVSLAVFGLSFYFWVKRGNSALPETVLAR